MELEMVSMLTVYILTNSVLSAEWGLTVMRALTQYDPLQYQATQHNNNQSSR